MIADPQPIANLHQVPEHLMSVPAEIITLHEDHQVTEVEVSRIRTRFRLRTPQEEKIEEIAESIKLVGLINPDHYFQ